MARLRWQFTTRTLFAVSLWTVPLWLGVRSSGLIDRLVYRLLMACMGISTAVPLRVLPLSFPFSSCVARRSHKWCFWRALGTGGLYGVVCFALLWGPLFVRGAVPNRRRGTFSEIEFRNHLTS